MVEFMFLRFENFLHVPKEFFGLWADENKPVDNEL